MIANGESNKVSVEMFQSVTSQLETKEDEISKLQATHTALEHKFSQEQEEFRRFKETSGMTIQKLKEVAAREIASARDETLNFQEQFEADISTEREAHRQEVQEVTLRMDAALRESRAIAEKAAKETTAVIGKLQENASKLEKELGGLREEKKSHEQQIVEMRSAILKLESQLNEQHDSFKQLQARHESEKGVLKKSTEKQLGDLRTELEERLQAAIRESDNKLKETIARAEKAEKEIENVKTVAEKEKEEQEEKAATTQAELDDLMLVMADLEENVRKYKVSLKSHIYHSPPDTGFDADTFIRRAD